MPRYRVTREGYLQPRGEREPRIVRVGEELEFDAPPGRDGAMTGTWPAHEGTAIRSAEVVDLAAVWTLRQVETKMPRSPLVARVREMFLAGARAEEKNRGR